MVSNLLDNPKLFRHLVEDLPMGIYIVDPERRIRFWNHGAEHITGHLSYEVVGLVLDDVVQACDRHGNRLAGEQRPVTTTISEREPQQCTAFYLHKGGHRVAVKIRTRPILEYGDTIGERRFCSKKHSWSINHRCLQCMGVWTPSSEFLHGI